VQLIEQRPDARSSAAGAPDPDTEVIVIIGGHPQAIDKRDTPDNAVRPSAGTRRKHACHSVATAEPLTPRPTPPSLETLKGNEKQKSAAALRWLDSSARRENNVQTTHVKEQPNARTKLALSCDP
jgi:hypothetical protein